MDNLNTAEFLKELKKDKTCSTCQYRTDVPGSAHSSCQHPVVKDNIIKTGLMVRALLGSGDINPLGIVATIRNKETKEVEAEIPLQDWNRIGIEKGYVIYPDNFDPTWLNYCLLHTKTGE